MVLKAMMYKIVTIVLLRLNWDRYNNLPTFISGTHWQTFKDLSHLYLVKFQNQQKFYFTYYTLLCGGFQTNPQWWKK